MGDVDALQDAEERSAQLAEEAERELKRSQQEELAAKPVKETARRPRSPELLALDQIEVLSNIRHDLDQIQELALSIKERGLLSPLLVRRSPPGATRPYQLVAGRRRYEALLLLEANEPNALVRVDVLDELTEAEVYELMFTENVQRVPLKPIEVARALRYLLDLNPDLSASSLARSLGLRPDWARRHFRLLELPEEVQERLERGDLSFTVADLLRRGQKKGLSEEKVKEVAAQVVSGEVSTEDVRGMLSPTPALESAEEAQWEEAVPSDAEEAARQKLERQADAILAAAGARPLAAGPAEGGQDVVFAEWSSTAAGDRKASPSKRSLDAYLLGRALKDLAADAYLRAIRVERGETYEYAASLGHAELLDALRRLAGHLAIGDPDIARVQAPE